MLPLKYAVIEFQNNILTIEISKKERKSNLNAVCDALTYIHNNLEEKPFKQAKYSVQLGPVPIVKNLMTVIGEDGVLVKKINLANIKDDQKEATRWYNNLSLVKLVYTRHMTDGIIRMKLGFTNLGPDNMLIHHVLEDDSSVRFTYVEALKPNDIEELLKLKALHSERYYNLVYDESQLNGVGFMRAVTRSELENNRWPCIRSSDGNAFNLIIEEINKNKAFYQTHKLGDNICKVIIQNMSNDRNDMLPLITSPIIGFQLQTRKEIIEPPTKKVKIDE